MQKLLLSNFEREKQPNEYFFLTDISENELLEHERSYEQWALAKNQALLLKHRNRVKFKKGAK